MPCLVSLRNLILIADGHVSYKSCHLACLITSVVLGLAVAAKLAGEPPVMQVKGETRSWDFALCGKMVQHEELDLGVDLVLTLGRFGVSVVIR